MLSSNSHNSLSVATLDSNLVEQVYARCASVYDWLCGPILQAGRREAMYELRRQPGNQIPEIGIGTGLTVPLYPDDYAVTGIVLGHFSTWCISPISGVENSRAICVRRLSATSSSASDLALHGCALASSPTSAKASFNRSPWPLVSWRCCSIANLSDGTRAAFTILRQCFDDLIFGMQEIAHLLHEQAFDPRTNPVEKVAVTPSCFTESRLI